MIRTEKECAELILAHGAAPWLTTKQMQESCYPSAVKEGGQGPGRSSDWFGIRWLVRDDGFGGMPDTAAGAVITDITRWEAQLRFPDVDQADWAACAARDTAGWDRAGRLTNCSIPNGLFESLHLLCGFESALCALLEEEAAVAAYAMAFADYKISLVERIHRYYRPDKITMHDDYGNQTNLFMPPDVWRRIFKPALKKIVDAVHGLGMYYEQHSCGMVRALFDDFVELGVDCVNPVQVQNDPPALQARYADRLTLVGCFNKQALLDREDATEAEIRASLRDTLTVMSRGRGWIPDMFFLNRARDRIWKELIDEWNRPLYEACGISPRKQR